MHKRVKTMRLLGLSSRTRGASASPFSSCRPSFPFPFRPFLVFCLVLLAPGCGSRDPFSYTRVNGKIVYEDGTLIPVDPLVLTFYPQRPPIDAKTFPRVGTAHVDKETGTFRAVTTSKPGDGLVRGKHKVTLTDSWRQPLDASLVPPEYGDPAKTPLEVDTADLPFELEVRKPSSGGSVVPAKGKP